MPMLETNRLSVRYGTKTIVDSLSFSVSEGQWLMIVGDMTWVKVTEIDEKGRVNLSRKDALKELAAAADKK